MYGLRTQDLPDPASTDDVAKLLGVNTQTIRRLVHTGELEALRVGGNFRITHAALGSIAHAHVWFLFTSMCNENHHCSGHNTLHSGLPAGASPALRKLSGHSGHSGSDHRLPRPGISFRLKVRPIIRVINNSPSRAGIVAGRRCWRSAAGPRGVLP